MNGNLHPLKNNVKILFRSVEYVQSVQLKLMSKWMKIMQCQLKISPSFKGLSKEVGDVSGFVT